MSLEEDFGELNRAVLSELPPGSRLAERIGSAAGDGQESLEPLAADIGQELAPLLKAAAKRQKSHGVGWRFAEQYQPIRRGVCAMLELAGRIRAPALSACLREAAGLADPRIVTCAVLALLRRKERVGSKPLEVAAACHETRAMLYEGLESLGPERRFPAKWRTFEAFAAARMVEWLAFPTELGREPDELELGERIWVDRKAKVAVYVWKFRNKGEAWKAGVSGPHKLVGKARPVEGWMTFSRFEDWDSATPEGHVGKCSWTVNEMAGRR